MHPWCRSAREPMWPPHLISWTHSGSAGGVTTRVGKATGTKSEGGLRLERAGEGRHSMPEIWGRFLGPGVGSAAGGRRAGVQPALPAARR